jgi:N-acylmannosamine kinase
MVSQHKDASRPSGVAVDFGGTKISAARVSKGRVGKTVRANTDGDASVGDQISAIGDLLDQLELRDDEPVGIALAGRVNSDGEWYALNTETLTKVDAVPLRRLMSERLGRPVVVQNDATAAAIGEHVAGAGRGTRSFAFITVSTGVGGGIILNGQPVISANGLAGHVGFTTSRIATGRCGSGRMQTVESVASGRAIAALARQAGHNVPDARAVYAAHLAGESWASDLVRQSAAAVAELCANLKSVLDLERIALGGSIGLAQGYLDMVRQELAGEPEIFRPGVLQAELGQDAAIIGVLVANSP